MLEGKGHDEAFECQGETLCTMQTIIENNLRMPVANNQHIFEDSLKLERLVFTKVSISPLINGVDTHLSNC